MAPLSHSARRRGSCASRRSTRRRARRREAAAAAAVGKITSDSSHLCAAARQCRITPARAIARPARSSRGPRRTESRRDRSRTASRTVSRTRTRPGKKTFPVARRFRPARAHRRMNPDAGGTRGSCLAEEPKNKRAASASPRRRLLPPRRRRPGRTRRRARRRRPGGGHRGEQRLGDSQRGGARGIVHGGVRDVPAQTGFHQARRVASRSAPTPASSSSCARGGARGGARAFSLDRDAPASLRGFGFFWKRFAVEARRDFFVRLL